MTYPQPSCCRGSPTRQPKKAACAAFFGASLSRLWLASHSREGERRFYASACWVCGLSRAADAQRKTTPSIRFGTQGRRPWPEGLRLRRTCTRRRSRNKIRGRGPLLIPWSFGGSARTPAKRSPFRNGADIYDITFPVGERARPCRFCRSANRRTHARADMESAPTVYRSSRAE